MELLFVAIAGAMIGALLRYLLPNRRSYGAMLVPAIGLAVASAVWAALTWAGWAFDGGWIWVLSIALATAASLTTALWLPLRRRTADARLLSSLIKV